jgi:hypothetical protein
MLLERDPDSTTTAQRVRDYEAKVAKLAADADDLTDRLVDPAAGPLHQSVGLLKNQMVNIIKEIETLPLRYQDEMGDHSPQGRAFAVALQVIQCGNSECRAWTDRRYLWWSLVSFQSDILLYLVSQLCERTEGRPVDQAWDEITYVFELHPELFEVATDKDAAKIARLTLRAWDVREGVLRARSGGLVPVLVPDFIASLQVLMADDEGDSQMQGLAGDMGQADMPLAIMANNNDLGSLFPFQMSVAQHAFGDPNRTNGVPVATGIPGYDEDSETLALFDMMPPGGFSLW